MGFIGKTELAREFSPNVSDDAARKRLMRWIEQNGELSDRLEKLGYTRKNRLFTDPQAQLIREILVI